MSPELPQLLEAYHEKLTCSLDEKPQRVATFERLLGEALVRIGKILLEAEKLR